MNQLPDVNAALEAVKYPTAPAGLYEPIAYVLDGGGKRLRPTLLLRAYTLYRNDPEAVMPAALALETYHNHTLLHDDLMDNADVRRGRAAVHKKWDANTAILSGDVMLILAVRHLLDCHNPHEAEATRLFVDMMTGICEGQQFDMNFERRNDVSLAEYEEMIRLKTAIFLGYALRIGAVLAGAPEADAKALYDVGEAVGLAFQIQDDYLDCYADPTVFGKRVGGDILCGKKTFMLISALAAASPEVRADLLSLLPGGAQHDALSDEARIAAVIAHYDALDIPARAQEAIETHYARARQALERIALPAAQLEPLWSYLCSMLGRKA